MENSRCPLCNLPWSICFHNQLPRYLSPVKIALRNRASRWVDCSRLWPVAWSYATATKTWVWFSGLHWPLSVALNAWVPWIPRCVTNAYDTIIILIPWSIPVYNCLLYLSLRTENTKLILVVHSCLGAITWPGCKDVIRVHSLWNRWFLWFWFISLPQPVSCWNWLEFWSPILARC